ncbi:MAG: CarD family transcriptional regulator [Anaerolineales bacterium]|jgi:RNA polymerase-interacting CarD/CdnL/TRCF family regulator
MTVQKISFQIGDQVVHSAYGPGVIIELDEKKLSGRSRQYYVVEVHDLTLWVPIDQVGDRNLRRPTPAGEFERLFTILSSPGDALPPDRHERKLHLLERLQGKNLESVCLVIRDLTLHRNTSRMNDTDNAILERSREALLLEWSNVLSIPMMQAERELRQLLEGGKEH